MSQNRHGHERLSGWQESQRTVAGVVKRRHHLPKQPVLEPQIQLALQRLVELIEVDRAVHVRIEDTEGAAETVRPALHHALDLLTNHLHRLWDWDVAHD